MDIERAADLSGGKRSAEWLRFDRLVVGIPPIVALVLLACYLIAPEFYLGYVLEGRAREFQVVELVTFSAAAAASLLIASAAALLYRRSRHTSHRPLRLSVDCLLAAIIAAACFFFAGEEISWGQTWFGGDAPEWLTEDLGSRERNLHNSELPVQSAASAFLIVIFFVLPIAWLLDRRPRRLPWPDDLALAVPRWSVAAAIGWAYSVKLLKESYRLLRGKETARGDAIYIEYFEQLNEQKEMLVALALFAYGVSLWLRLRETHSPHPRDGQPVMSLDADNLHGR